MSNALQPFPREDLLPPVRVLVVDDNAGFRESLIALLNTEDLMVVGEAATGEEALDLASALGPDVVLMDVRMPLMDGVEATRKLKELLPEVGVVALTGNEAQQSVREMLVAGASGYVLKDSDGDDILNAVRQAAHGAGVISPEVTPLVIGELGGSLQRERQRTEELSLAHEALIERAARRQEQIARLGHELRTPVTVILGMAQILASGKASPEQHQDILDRLVSRASDLARLLERFELAADAALTERIDLAEVANRVAAQHPRVRVAAGDELPRADLNPIVAGRLLEELVDNALRFSSEQSPVEIRIQRGAAGLELRVCDRGPGIDPEFRERIFSPLEQAEALNARTHQGTGMGLSLARTAARSADGDIVLESSGSEGSVFLWRIGRSAGAAAEPNGSHIQAAEHGAR